MNGGQGGVCPFARRFVAIKTRRVFVATNHVLQLHEQYNQNHNKSQYIQQLIQSQPIPSNTILRRQNHIAMKRKKETVPEKSKNKIVN